MTARLHVLLGAGGVGKTTLAAGYALALAKEPSRRVGLLGIDPSRRLKDALGVPLRDEDAVVPGEGSLRAAVLLPEETVRRWATEACPDPRQREQLMQNMFFVALADRLATATDVFAAARLAEWVERDPHLTDLVVDTAPGLNAVEFLTRPERLTAFLGGRLVGWLRWLARRDATGASVDRLGGGRRVVWGLSRVGGARMLLELADFFSLVEGMFARLLSRVEIAERWLRDPTTELIVVTSVRDDAARTARALGAALGDAGLRLRAVVVNRALPGATGDRAALEAIAASEPASAPVIRYALAYEVLESQVVQSIRALGATTVIVPDVRGLDGDERLAALARLGGVLRAALMQRRVAGAAGG
jgi:anion-transporting  ArsA/GET3 family ATPase